MAWCLHPSPCQCPAVMGETDDGAKGFNSQITDVQQRNLCPAGRASSCLPGGDPSPALPRGGTSCVPWPWARGGRGGADMLCIDGAASKIGGSVRKVFAWVN